MPPIDLDPLVVPAIARLNGRRYARPVAAWRLRLGRDDPCRRCHPLPPSGLAAGSSRRGAWLRHRHLRFRLD